MQLLLSCTGSCLISAAVPAGGGLFSRHRNGGMGPQLQRAEQCCQSLVPVCSKGSATA